MICTFVLHMPLAPLPRMSARSLARSLGGGGSLLSDLLEPLAHARSATLVALDPGDAFVTCSARLEGDLEGFVHGLDILVHPGLGVLVLDGLGAVARHLELRDVRVGSVDELFLADSWETALASLFS